MQWDLTEIRNEIRRRDWEVRWEHARRSPEEDRKTRCKNARGCRIDGRFGLHPKKIDSERRCASRRRTYEWTQAISVEPL
ncbi:hypothetical protein BHM03_00057321 [Ensete ventricosum]|nr:hypothetical protein BHM03_00057321 [Ensete ventricosum]